jgi:hypothetical protein
MPVLDELFPGAAARVSHSAALLQAARGLLERELERVFGPAAAREWSRAELAPLPLEIIAAGLRRACLDELAIREQQPGDCPGQRQLLAAAEAVASDDTSPRAFQLADQLMLLVRSRTVEFRAGPAASGDARDLAK